MAVARGSYRMQGRTVTSFKVEDKRDHSIHLVSLDRGTEISEARLEAEEIAAIRARYGALDPRLHERVAQARADEEIPVAIWLRDNYDPPQRPDPQTATEAETERFLQTAGAQRAEHVARLTGPFVQRMRELDPGTIRTVTQPCCTRHSRRPSSVAWQLGRKSIGVPLGPGGAKRTERGAPADQGQPAPGGSDRHRRTSRADRARGTGQRLQPVPVGRGPGRAVRLLRQGLQPQHPGRRHHPQHPRDGQGHCARRPALGGWILFRTGLADAGPGLQGRQRRLQGQGGEPQLWP